MRLLTRARHSAPRVCTSVLFIGFVCVCVCLLLSISLLECLFVPEMMPSTQRATKEVCYQYWPGKRAQTYGEFRVELLSEGWKSGFLSRNFSVQQAKFAIAHQVWQFHIPEWSSDYQWRGDVNAIVSVIEEVSKVRRKTGNHPIVVHGL
ncbi:Receptor-type tyrosine-protein phosphatase alpha [Geodia barretti]|uniref:Receptor-type tyrosine-protein phosphatase alpha n=3 Tax=Geodia barretti TaxID=519541 RepID=A0AA35WU90_GEOBA|nr:Receptor-type tyrosine-protein phosphatase alpha [Geodia barretti]